jgi:hypothetical protein
MLWGRAKPPRLWNATAPDLFVDIDFDFCDPCIALRGKAEVLAKVQELAGIGRLFPQ